MSKTIDSSDISVVIQGAIDKVEISKCLNGIRNYLPNAESILSTWEGSDIAGLDYDVLVLNEDPGFYPMDSRPNSKENNVNRQIQTVLCGLHAATREYAFKLRSDFVLNGSGFLNYFNLFLMSDPNYKIFERKLLSCVFFARNPRYFRPKLFHPSDIAFFGLRSDLINLFDVPHMIKKESGYYEANGYYNCRYTPEQHIWINCLRKNCHKIDFDNQLDINEKNIEDTERYAVSNFIFLDWKQFNLVAPRRLRAFANNDFHDSITHIEWLRLYKQYLENTLVVPNKDPMRDLINRRTKKFEWCRAISKICTMFFIGKRLQNFRKNARKCMLSYLAKNIILPK